jgi:tRNA A-37 threonylcarbamoyl transferase component Bud32
LVDDSRQVPYDAAVLRTEYQGLQWELAPDFEALLPQVLGQPGESVKTSAVTVVTRHRVANREFYVKRYLHEERGLASFSYFLRAAKSQREWKWSAEMSKRGVAVVPHLAHGERWSWRGLLQSTLITEGLPGYSILKGSANLSSSELQYALGQFLRHVHDAGVIYHDLAPQNVLYSPVSQAFCFLDVDKVACRKRLRRKERRDNIVLLALRMPLADPFYEGYGKDRPQDAERIAERAQTEWQKVMTRMSRRWRKHTHEIAFQRIGEIQWYVRTALADERLHRLMEDPETFCVHGVEGLSMRRFGLAAARRAYQEAYRLELLGQTCSRPVAVGEKRMWGICLRSYFVATT